MVSDRHLHFLQEKIQELRSALFYSLSNSVLRIPTSIVTALRVDESGQVWFFVSKPKHQLTEYDRQFPARLEFYKKGKGSLIKIVGRACIVNDTEEVKNLVTLPEELKEKAMDQLLLVKLKIDKAAYYETSTTVKGNGFTSALNQLKRWLLGEPAGHKSYEFEPI